MSNEVFGKIMENVRKNRDIKLVTKETRRNYLVSELNYHTTKSFTENLFAIKIKKTQIYMNKPVFTVYIKIDDIYKDIAEDVKTRCDTSNYKLHRPLP